MLKPHKLFGRLGNQMFQGAYIYAQMRKGLVPDIYVQDPKYFEEFKNEIKAMYGQDIKQSDYVAIHVRRGDYVNNPFYVDLMKTDYYQKAMALFPNEKFKVFSDDIEWCLKQPIFANAEFSRETDDVVAMNDMAGCKGVITANSSYSWWAGYLCKGKVIYSSKWYTDGFERTVCPNEWVKI